jgi:protein NrfC
MKSTKNDEGKLIDSIEKNNLSTRREFLKVVGVFAVSVSGAGLLSCDSVTENGTVSMGYILVDPAKCQGCLTCMISCSLVNEGCVNLSLSRIQVQRNTFGVYPNNIRVTQCRQCEDPKCVTACSNGALIVDTENGNIRLVNMKNCNGCGRCIQACPYEPERPIVAPNEQYGGTMRSRKCDLCLNAPHHWDPAGGGVDGKQACVASCPLNAIKFTTAMPTQEGNDGYNVNMRGTLWGDLGLGYDYDLNYDESDE